MHLNPAGPPVPARRSRSLRGRSGRRPRFRPNKPLGEALTRNHLLKCTVYCKATPQTTSRWGIR